MDLESLKNKIKKKHLLIIGGTESERKDYITKVIAYSNFSTYRFPKGMNESDTYFDFVKKNTLYTPYHHSGKNFNSNQLFDFHLDWFYHNDSLVILEEFQEMDERWRIELLRLYILECENHKKGEKFIHLIISQDSENGIIEKLIPTIRLSENEVRTKTQVISGSL